MISSSSIGGGPKHIFLLSELIKKEILFFMLFQNIINISLKIITSKYQREKLI